MLQLRLNDSDVPYAFPMWEPRCNPPSIVKGHQSWSTRERADMHSVRRFKSRPALRLRGDARTAEQHNPMVSETKMNMASDWGLTNGDAA
jgi:hypothetical protein